MELTGPVAGEPSGADAVLARAVEVGAVRRHAFLDGLVALFSARAPDKETVNEDSAAILPYDDSSGALVVADGLGGGPDGEAASALAVEVLADVLGRGAQEGLALRDAVLDGIEKANRRVLALSSGAATTVAVVTVEGEVVRTYHVGDSAILVCGQRGRIKLQTVPHSPVGYAVEAGVLDEHEAAHHADRHLVSNVVGSEDMRIEVGTGLRLAPRDTVVVASDGLLDNCYVGEVVERVRKGPLGAAARALADLAGARMRGEHDGAPSHPDDLTFLVYRRLGRW